ncbi:MAG: hypothetical protein J1F01_06005 [Oscillospiraceae bacterium]|nr:hypothetical protein [Oscillospiraceae bacterium]
MKKIVAVISALALCLSLTACGGGTNKAENVVEGALGALKSVNIDKLTEYVDIDYKDLDTYKLKQYEPVFEAISENLDYKIISTEQKDDNNVVVKTEVTVSDLSPFIGDYLPKTLKYMMANFANIASGAVTQENAEQELSEMLKESLANTDLSNLITKELSVRVKKGDDKKWKVHLDDSFVSSMFTTLFSAAYQNIGNAVSEGLNYGDNPGMDMLDKMMEEFTTPQ